MPVKDVLLFWFMFFAVLCLLELVSLVLAGLVRKVKKKFKSELRKPASDVPYKMNRHTEKRSA